MSDLEIKDLKPSSKRVNIIVQLIKKGDTRNVKGGYTIALCVVGDPTGEIKLTLWNDEIEKINFGDVIEIHNGYVSTYQGQMQLNIGKFGAFQHIDAPEGFYVNKNHQTTPNAENEEINHLELINRQTKNLTLRVLVKELIEERTVRTRRDGKQHQVATYLIGDETACILMQLWDEWNAQIIVGQSIIIQGGYINTFRQQRFLNITRSGQIRRSPQNVQFNENVRNLSNPTTA